MKSRQDTPAARSPGQHARGNAKAPVLLILTRDFDETYGKAFEHPLKLLHARGEVDSSAYSEADVLAGGTDCWKPWIWECRPKAVLLTRYGCPDGREILEYCHQRGLPVICHVDDDLLELPPSMAEEPQQHHMAQKIMEARHAMLAGCDVIFASNASLGDALRRRFPTQLVFHSTGSETVEEMTRQVVHVTMRLAKRSPWQKLQGFGARVHNSLARRAWGPIQRAGDPQKASTRILFVANSFLPTLQLCFTRPLQPLADANEVAWEVLADIQLHAPGRVLSGGRGGWARRRIAAFQPDLVVFCRYSGPNAALITNWARRHNIPTVYHLDDDLLNVPPELGAEKYAFHNQPVRLASVRHLLRTADLVYCSTVPLLERMQEHGIGGLGLAARIHCPGEVLRAAPGDGVFKIGYMGIDHAHDFQVTLPALIRILERNPEVRFELFGPIAKPAELDRFGERVTQIEYVRSYDEFLRKFAESGWSVGICPLADTPFNRTKANNKWVEYTAVGAAVVASAGMLYDECCADGCGLVAADDGQWEAALQSLITDGARRVAMVRSAQARLARDYSMVALRQQLQEVFREARACAGHRAAAGRVIEA